MKATTAEWVEKAEEDYALAALASKSKRRLNNGVCFHCQQCAEKYLKARLVEAGIVFPRTHNLPALLDLALAVEPLWEPFRQPLDLLTRYGVEVRYPGDQATKQEAKEALVHCRAFRRRARAGLGLTVARRKKGRKVQRSSGDRKFRRIRRTR